jgi:hypothetical protein
MQRSHFETLSASKPVWGATVASWLLVLPCWGEDNLPAELQLTNALRLNYASSDRVLSDETDYLLTTLQSKATFVLSPSVRGAMLARAGGQLHPDSSSSADLPYAYLDVTTSALDIRIGKQILAWGKTDALNPTDVVTPRDYTTLLPFDEDERSGVWGVNTTYFATDTIFATLFVSENFEPSTLPFVSNDEQIYYFDEGTGKRPQFGTRVGANTGDIDFSFSAYRGPGLLAQAEQIDVLSTGEQLITLRYPDITMFGFDLARNIGKFGVRMEGSSVQPNNEGSVAANGMQPYHILVAGVDRTLYGDLNINVQLYSQFNKPEGVVSSPAVSDINGLIFAQNHRITNGITFRIANQWKNQTVSAELFARHYFSDSSTYLHPMASYALTDEFKWTVGAAWYIGNDGTLFGVLKKNNSIFSELRYSF